MSIKIQPRSQPDVRLILARADILPTRQRLHIGEIMFARPQHLSADQVLDLAHRRGHRISKATVYNTLRLFCRKGILREVLVDPSRIFFDSNTDDHHHLYNEDTGLLTDIPAGCLRPDAFGALPAGTELVGVDVIVRIRGSRRG
ncbi:MAG: transcriptional repressor [Pseudomonadota bacterium]|nr:transcriptional repressor [Pseudomonadota bacterium]